MRKQRKENGMDNKIAWKDQEKINCKNKYKKAKITSFIILF